MTIQSMTGFGRSQGTTGAWTWTWEVRSVNGRGLDLRLRLPLGFELLEPRVRDTASKRLSRGNVTATLAATCDNGDFEVRLNEAALSQLIKAAGRVRELVGGEPLRTEALLSLKGILEIKECAETEDQTRAAQEGMLGGFSSALDDLVIARRAEGERLKHLVSQKIEDIARLTESVARAPGRSPDAVKARLHAMISRLMEQGQNFDEARLHQEAVLLATRADVEEEITRLGAHVAAAHELLSGPGPVGRKLDFLVQELNREANTLCSKANDAEITKAGLALKVAIDQMREQVQNIE